MYPIAFHIGSFAVHWYGIFIGIGFLVSFCLLLKLKKYASLTSDQIYNKDLVAICRVVTDSQYYPAYTGVSIRIDEIFRTIGAPNGCVSKRRPVAAANGYIGYSGTLSENLALIKLAKAGKLRRV